MGTGRHFNCSANADAMRIPSAVAAFVALSVLSQPTVAVLCALDCSGRPEATHCESGVTNAPDAPASGLSSGVALCGHSVSVQATLNERLEVFRPMDGLLAVFAVRFSATLSRDRRHALQSLGVPPGIPFAARPLRI